VPEISWDGAAHSSNGVILHDMVRDVIIRDHNFSISAIYRYILTYNLEWYPSLGGTIAYFPLFIPFLFMLSYFVLGISFSSAYLVVIVMGNICIITTFLMGAELFDKRIGVVASLFLSISSIYIAYSKTALLDLPAATMYILSVYFLILTKKKLVKKQKPIKQSFLTGLFIGLAFMTKPTCILIFPTIVLYFVITYTYKLKDRHLLKEFQKAFQILKNNLWILYGIIPAFILIGFQMGIFIFSGTFKLWIGPFSHQKSAAGSTALQGMFFYITGIGLSLPELVGFLSGLAYAIYKRTNQDKLILSWYFVVYLSLSVIHTRTRFFLIAFPVVFLLLSRAILKLYDHIKIYHHKAIKMGTILVIGITLLFGVIETIQYPYAEYDITKMPVSETSMEEAALFLIEKGGITMQMTLNPTISASAMTFYIIKHDREHKLRYYDAWWATERGKTSIEEFRDVINQLEVSYFLISDPGNDPNFKILDKYANYIFENPKALSLVRVYKGEYSIYIYKLQEPF